MKKVDSWSSEYRKKKFYDNQRYKKEKNFFEGWSKPIPKTISVMLDLEDTCDYIDDDKAAYFIKQLDEIRKQFCADYATISISTHYDSSDSMREVLDILSRNLTKNVKIGMNFYYGGRYDYENDVDIYEAYNFNSRKVETFKDYCVDDIGTKNQWFAIIDDSVYEDTYKSFQNKHPMVVCRPSQTKVNSNNINFMNLATETKGFDGVIEMMDEYMKSIKSLTRSNVLAKQKFMLRHLSSYELTKKIRDREYEFLVRYFSEGYADEDDYNDTLTWLGFTISLDECFKKDLDNLKGLLKLLMNKFKENEDYTKINSIKVFEKIFDEN